MTNMQKHGEAGAVQKLLNGGRLSARHLASMGKILGTLCISRLINLRKCKSAITHSGQPELRNVLSIGLLNRPVLNRTTDMFIRKRQRRLLRHGFW
jgi:hypothetical protein